MIDTSEGIDIKKQMHQESVIKISNMNHIFAMVVMI